jgi:tetratricopeptide (TPR) repeat protein
MPSTLAHPNTMEIPPTRNFVRRYLPWLVAAGMLLFYLITLDRTVTVASVLPLARASGADWHPVYIAPLNWLVTLPIRWLPPGAQLFGLNFIGALCAALTLALLARSVALLPHDRTALQRDKKIDQNAFLNIRLAWVPVLFAVVVVGLQRTFWESAIINTGEALDVLLFAYCVRCLFEYRVEENTSWLYRLAVVYGIGITNNFAMIAFFPVLLVALVWIKGLRFFRFDFLVRMFLFGLAGLSLYLLLPLVQSQSDVASVSFWPALKANLSWQKQIVFSLRRAALLPSIYALVPLLLMGLKWSNSFGDESPMGRIFANAAAVLLHAGLLAFCVYVAFDPPVSPRGIAVPYRDLYGINFSFLPCYFLGGLIVGYYSGFLLLVFSIPVEKARRRSAMPPAANFAVATIVCAGAAVAAVLLLRENYPKIRGVTARSLHDYATEIVKSLPDKAVILSDDPVRLHAVGAVLGRAALDKHILAETASMTTPGYHRFLRKRYGDRLPQIPGAKDTLVFSSPQVVQLLGELRAKYELTYLHPGFGYYFETFYAEPRGLVHVLKPYPTNSVEAPVPDADLIARQAVVWTRLEMEAGALQDLKPRLAGLPEKDMQRSAGDAAYVGACYSRALDFWGVELQRAGKFDEAAGYFDKAIALNSYNVSAMINRDANALWRKERKRLPNLSAEAVEKLKVYRGVEGLLAACGPVDEPSVAMEFVNVFAQGGLFRQAEQMARRALSYVPDEITYQTTLANVAVMRQQPDRALAQIEAIRAQPSLRTATPGAQIELARVEAWAQYSQSNFAAAQKTLEKAVRDFPELDASYTTLSQLYVVDAGKLRADGNEAGANAQLTNALKVIEGQLRLQPANATAWFNFGYIVYQIHDYDRAIEAFTKVLDLTQRNEAALLNRAMAHVQAKHWDAAKRDYRELLDKFTSTDYRVYYGLGEVAYQQKDWRAARDYYKGYLRYVPPQSGESKAVRARLEEIKNRKT